MANFNLPKKGIVAKIAKPFLFLPNWLIGHGLKRIGEYLFKFEFMLLGALGFGGVTALHNCAVLDDSMYMTLAAPFVLLVIAAVFFIRWPWHE